MKPSDVLHADTNAEGYLEWLSGLIVVQRTLAQWQAIASNRSALDQDLAQLKRTLIHEAAGAPHANARGSEDSARARGNIGAAE